MRYSNSFVWLRFSFLARSSRSRLSLADNIIEVFFFLVMFPPHSHSCGVVPQPFGLALPEAGVSVTLLFLVGPVFRLDHKLHLGAKQKARQQTHESVYCQAASRCLRLFPASRRICFILLEVRFCADFREGASPRFFYFLPERCPFRGFINDTTIFFLVITPFPVVEIILLDDDIF